MSSYLEDHFPHLIPRLTENWGKPQEFGAVIFDLFYDSRGGRSGWPLEAWQELTFLEALHKEMCKDGEEDDDEEVHDSIKWVS